MRLLVVSPSATHPEDEDDRVRTRGLLSRLKRFGHAVDLVVAPLRPLGAGTLDLMRAAWDRVVVVPPGRPAADPVPGVPRALDDWFPPALEPALRDLTARQHYDAVIVRHLHLSRALEAVPDGTLTILQTSGIAATGIPSTGFRTGWAEEARGLDRADLVLAPDEDDRALLQALTRRPVRVLGLSLAATRRTASQGLRIGLIAPGDITNTRAASRFLAATDLGQIAASGGVLRVGGAVANRLGGARDGLDLITDGNLPLSDLDLLVFPQEAVPERPAVLARALADGLPLIGTAAAFRGLPARSPWHAAPDAESVARLVRRWLSSDEARGTVAADGADLAARHAAEVDRHYATFRDIAALRALAAPPRALAVTDRPVEGRLDGLARTVGPAMDLDLLLLGDAAGGEPPSSATLGAWRQVLRADGVATGERAAIAAIRAALAARSYDLLLLGGEHLPLPRPMEGGPMLRVLDTDPAGTSPSLDRCARFAGFDLVLTRSPGQHAATEAALPGHALYLPSPAPDFPCPDRARPVRRIAIAAGETPGGTDALRWFLHQAWPVLALEGLECLVVGTAGATMPEPLPPGVVPSGPGDDDPLATADLAVNVVTGAESAYVTREYLLRGLPSVLSERAAEEIGGGEGRAFLVARSRTELVAHLQRLTHDPSYRRLVGEAAFRLGRARFGRPVAAAAARGLADLASSLRQAA